MKPIPASGLIGEAALREAGATEMGQVMSLARAALQDKLGVPYVEIEAMFPDRVVACRDGRYYSYPFTIGEDNKVAVGDAAEVIEQYVPVRMSEAIGADCAFLESADPEGLVWDVVLIRAGLAKNSAKTFYPDAVLREAAPLFDGVRALVRSEEDHLKSPAAGRDARNIAGWFSEPRFVEGNAPDTGYIGARFHFAAGMTSLRESVADAWKRGKRDLIGFSIDAAGAAKKAVAGFREGAKRIATAITKVFSVDIIVDASAGGALVRLVEAADTDTPTREQDAMKERMLATIKAKAPQLFAKINLETITDEELEARYAEALATPAPAAAATGVSAEQLAETVRMVEARAYLRTAVATSKLPQAAQDKLLADWGKRERFAEADVDAAIKTERTYLAHFSESGKVMLDEKGDIVVEDRAAKIADMFDAFFDPAHKNHRDVHSFKECYVEMTGDRRVTGRMENVDRARLAEAVGAAFRESLDSTSFANVLGDSITRRMVAEFRAAVQFDAWRQIASVVPVQDFRTQERTMFGGYGDLPTVLQGDPYTSLASPTDDDATYAVAKRGGTEDVTLEMIKNDDVGAIRRIPVKLGRAAKRTLAKFVFDFIRTNPNIYDGTALFTVGHGNLGTTAFSATEYGVVRVAMLKQTELSSADRMGIGPKGILCPPDLESAVWTAFQRSTNLDKDFIQTLNPVIIPVWYWTDITDWAAYADPSDLPGIEIGFLDGQEEPELFVQDQPNVGSMFSNDQLTYKIRHIYGGAVVPGGEKAFYKEVVAG